jgi:transposase
MSRTTRSASRRSRTHLQVQKPNGVISDRVKLVGPECFAILSIDVSKPRFKMMLCDFYGQYLIQPTEVDQTQGGLHAAIDRVREALAQAGIQDQIVAIERTGEYHRPVQRAFRNAGFEVRLVHPFASKQFRQAAHPGNKTDDTDLTGIHCAAVNGFGLIEPALPPDYAELRILSRHRRDLVHKTSTLCCQVREHLHMTMPGYAECFEDLWRSKVALPIARATGSAAALANLGVDGLASVVKQAGLRCRRDTLHKLVAWTATAPPGHPLVDSLRGVVADLDDDRQAKNQQIMALEGRIANLVARTPYIRLIIIPGINVVSTADLAAELGPLAHYANANAITGHAGLFPSRYQSDSVDHDDGEIIRCANRRLRTALMQIADNLVANNRHFRAKAALWRDKEKNARWMRVKVAKQFSRIAYAIVSAEHILAHPCLQDRHYVLQKLNAFHSEHHTPTATLLDDIRAAVEQLPLPERDAEAKPLQEELQSSKTERRRSGPELLSEIVLIVLARLTGDTVQSKAEGLDLS